MTNRGDEYYTLQAKKDGYLARSAYKLEEIQKKFDTLKWVKTVLDIGCAPGSRLQYLSKYLQKTRAEAKIIGFDLKPVNLALPYVHSYELDITDREWVKTILDEQWITKVDCIVSDMAPDTMGMSDIDGIRSIGLIEKTLWIYETYLKEWGTFAIKVFMGPGYEELLRELKDIYGNKDIVSFKPKSCRKASKEIYIVRRRR